MAQVSRVLVVAMVAVALAGCGGAAQSELSTGTTADAYAAATVGPAAEMRAAPAADMAMDAGGGTTANAVQPAPDQQGFSPMVIKTADIQLEVQDVQRAEQSIRTKVGGLNGYITNLSSSGTDRDMYITLSFRVPVDRFDEALDGVSALANKVLNRQVRGDDVTEEFVDLESRQRTLEGTRDRLLNLLNQTTKVNDILAVNQTLNDVQAQLDQVQGRKEYLSKSAAFSTVNVTLQPVPPQVTVEEKVEGWQPAEIASDALAGLIRLLQAILSVLIVIGVWVPVWLPPVLVLVWWQRRQRSRSRTPASTT